MGGNDQLKQEEQQLESFEAVVDKYGEAIKEAKNEYITQRQKLLPDTIEKKTMQKKLEDLEKNYADKINKILLDVSAECKKKTVMNSPVFLHDLYKGKKQEKSSNKRNMFTEEQNEEIRRKYEEGKDKKGSERVTLRSLAVEYGLGEQNSSKIYYIINGRSSNKEIDKRKRQH